MAKLGNEAFNNYVARLSRQHGTKFDDSGLAAKFAPYHGQRIEVISPWSETMRGWVGGTTGWRPSLMLLKRRTSSGSSELLDDSWTMVRVINKGPR